MFSSLRSRSKKPVGPPESPRSRLQEKKQPGPPPGKYGGLQSPRGPKYCREDGGHCNGVQSQKCSSLKPSCLTPQPRQGTLDKQLCQSTRDKHVRGIADNFSNKFFPKETVMPDAWQVEYEEGVEGTTTRVVGVSLIRSDQGLGITLRGGRFNPGQFHPLTITNIKPNGPADKEGTIKVGDRLLAVDGQPLTGLTLSEAQEVLREGTPGGATWLTVEYDVSVMSRLRTSGPLLVEIDSPNQPHNLGLSLIDSRGRVIVSKVHTATIAERCGALLPGDQILAVNEYRVENSKLTAKDVTKILNNFKGPLLQLEILPVPSITMRGNTTHRMCPPSPTLSAMSGSSKQHPLDNSMYADQVNFSSNVQPIISNIDKCTELRIESGVITLHSPPGQSFGLKLRWVPSKMAAVICDIEPNSVADRSGVLQIGDRITSVNGQGPAECSSLDSLGASTVVLVAHFDVQCHNNNDSTVSIRLSRSANSGFGITINGCSEYPSSIVVSNIRWGSVAHRCGQLSVGDQLIAINDQHIGGNIHLATEILQECGRLVSFVVVKQGANLDLGYSSPGLPSIVDSAIESWDSNEPNQPIAEFQRQPVTNSELHEGWKNRFINQSCNSIVTQQSEDNEEDSCSSYRLSESVIDAIASGQQRIAIHKAHSPPCPLQTNYKSRNVNMSNHWRGSSINNSNALSNLEALETELNIVAAQQSCPQTFKTFRSASREEGGDNSAFSATYKNCFQVLLHKDPIYEDFGFSVSDGLYERGVFINRMRPGGPADLSRVLQPFDRIIQVNDTKTDDFDCCLTVPLVASAGNTLTLTVLRQINTRQPEVKEPKSIIPWVDEAEDVAEVAATVEDTGRPPNQFAQTL